ncbi:MAG TPA: M28 family peptidase [Steroidobacteraceae bacterium]|nr:M28 family peptidase [Steroidobacteraceae bacterium]
MRFWGNRANGGSSGNWGVLASAGLLLTACAGTPKVPPPSTDIDEAVFRNHLRVLASDDFEGRKPGMPGEDKTVAYLTEQYRKLGLKPGNGDSFLQQVPMVEILAGADASLSVAGPKGMLPFSLGKDAVIWTKRVLPQAELRGSELVFVGYGIVAPEYAWNDYAGTDVHGKTVVVLVNDPGYASKDPRVFKGGTMTQYGRWAYKIEEAARQGAAGVLLIHDDAAVGYGWNVIQSTWSGAQLDLATADGNAGRALIEGWIQKDAARALFAAAGLDLAAGSAAAAGAGFKAMPLHLRLDATLHNSIRQFMSANVIALLPGGKRHREYVLYSAHWDHLGSDPAHPGHTIFNGATDNASGVAGLLAVAQSFVRTHPAPDRSIVFLALTGTESNLLGSRYYVENPVFPLRETAAVLNLDTLKRGGPTRDLTVFGFGNTDLEDTARAIALLQGRELTPEPTPEQGLYFRSDNFIFAKAGVPALYAQGGLDDSAHGSAWGRAQLDDYMRTRYHQPIDLYSPDWDVRGAIEDLQLYYDVGMRVANSRRFPRWYPNSEYRESHTRGTGS